MKIVSPSAISGFPEWLPDQKILESSYLNRITKIFESFGFVPIETPAVEKDDVLSSKGEINKQIYSIFRPNVETENERETGLSLHFDLTVPLARYVAQHFSQLTFPFKRYQIQKVWRGERAQKGRFREFYQCDIDTIGNGKLDIFADAEVAAVIYHIFKSLAIGAFRIHFSNRKLLMGIMEAFNITGEDSAAFIQILDKVERSAKGMQSVRTLLAEKVGGAEEINTLLEVCLTPDTSNAEILRVLKSTDIASDLYRSAVDELEKVYGYLIDLGCGDQDIRIDISIVRGLDYYTGTVFETFLLGHEKGLGSICSGGRYDDLASFFIDRKLPGVGISIGLTRLLSYLFEHKIVEQLHSSLSQVLICMLDRRFMPQYIKMLNEIQEAGINAEIYIEDESLGKQLRYANKKGIHYVILAGEDEFNSGTIKLKDMSAAEETTFENNATSPGIPKIVDVIKSSKMV
jgi:histidyl-tRNA synthetase